MQDVQRYLIPALWLAWLLYWAVAAIGAKATVREESFASRLSHTVPLAVGVALLATLRVPVAWLTARFVPHTTGWWGLGVDLCRSGACDQRCGPTFTRCQLEQHGDAETGS